MVTRYKKSQDVGDTLNTVNTRQGCAVFCQLRSTKQTRPPAQLSNPYLIPAGQFLHPNRSCCFLRHWEGCSPPERRQPCLKCYNPWGVLGQFCCLRHKHRNFRSPKPITSKFDFRTRRSTLTSIPSITFSSGTR